MKERIIELAGHGVPNHIIASTIGCEPSYVTQLLQQEEVAAQVGEMRAQAAAQEVKTTGTISRIREAALDKMERLLPMQTDLMKIAKVFQIVDQAKKASDAGSAVPQLQEVVPLALPAQAHVHFKITTERQVIEVEGRSMVPMQSVQVVKQLKELQAARLLEQPKPQMISNQTKSIIDQL